MSHVPAPPSLLSQRKDTTSISFLDENEHCLRGGGKACGAKRHPKEVTVPSNGLCLFHSIALFFGSRETDTNTLKRRALDIRVKTREFLTKCPRAGNARAVADEITRLSVPSWRGNYPRESWPGEVTLRAIATLFKVNISTFCLHKGSLVLTARFHKVLGEGEDNDICLLLHQGHYGLLDGITSGDFTKFEENDVEISANVVTISESSEKSLTSASTICSPTREINFSEKG